MNVLIIDQENLGLDFALRCAGAGHDVRWCKYGKPNKDGLGFKGLKIVDDWRPHMAWARDGLIICTGNFKYLPELDRYRDLGFKILAPTVQSAKLEIERGAGMKAMEAAGLDLPAYHTFDSLEAAEAFARKSDRAWVFKPMGDEEDKSLTYVSSDPADLVGWLQRQIARGKKLKGKCMLQEKIDMLCDFGVSAWMGPEGFLPDKWQICFEHKKLMPGENGPQTGEMGTVMQYVETDRIVDDLMKPIEPIIRALGHTCDFSIGAGIDKNGKAWPFEFTARLGWPAFYIQVASHKGDPAKWMRDLLDGKDSLRVSRDVAIGVVCAQPRFPYNISPPDLIDGNPIYGLDEVYEDVHCASVMIGKGPKMKDGKVVDGLVYQTTGEYVLICTGLGKSVEAARKKVYKTVDAVKFSDKMFRNDIGMKLEPILPDLHKFGYAEQMPFS